MEKFRGHNIELIDGKYRFCDTKELTDETWKDRPCGFCGLKNTPEDHDGCLGTLPGVMNACCGHGNLDESYVQMENGSISRGSEAHRFMSDLITKRDE